MAVRSGAGTGVIVSLVVFVLTTVFLVILTIVFYAGKTEALDRQAQSEAELAKYVRPQQLSTDHFKNLEQAASANQQSVTAYLSSRHDDLVRFVTGDPATSFEELKADLGRFGVAEDGTVRNALEDARRQARSIEVEIDGFRSKLAEREAELAEKEALVEQIRSDHQREMDQVVEEIDVYRQAANEYGGDVRETVKEMNLAVERLRDEYEHRIAELEDELDGKGQELVLLRSRVDEYEAILNKNRDRVRRPELLVDANVIDVETSNDLVFIDRGRRDRIVLGMTFEVYDDVASIRVDERTGFLPRGKASVQVVKVSETTSTCKITRAVPGRPVVRNNVLTNAIYDPEYQFKFLVHGKFDVDEDGRPSEAEAEYLRSLVVDWGGEVVHGDTLPGDLDFLVLGEMPPLPPPLPPDANAAQIEIWARKRAAHDRYRALFEQASEAQIPVLNANRFFILIGRTSR